MNKSISSETDKLSSQLAILFNWVLAFSIGYHFV